MKAREILEACIYAKDLEAAERFYRNVLGLDLISREAGRHVFLRCGKRVFLIFNPDATSVPGGDFPPHGAQGSCHVAFAASTEELVKWKHQLLTHGIHVEKDQQWPGGGRSLYFRDPAGNSVELASPKIWKLDEHAV